MLTAAWLIKARRYQWLLWVLIIALLAFGFDFKTPAAQFGEIKRKDAQQDIAISDLGLLVRALAIGQCLDRPPRETQLMGLHCAQLLEGQIQR